MAIYPHMPMSNIDGIIWYTLCSIKTPVVVNICRTVFTSESTFCVTVHSPYLYVLASFPSNIFYFAAAMEVCVTFIHILAVRLSHTGTSIREVEKCTYWKVTSNQNGSKLLINLNNTKCRIKIISVSTSHLHLWFRMLAKVLFGFCLWKFLEVCFWSTAVQYLDRPLLIAFVPASGMSPNTALQTW